MDMLSRRKVEICCVQEVRYRGAGTVSIGSNQDKYKLWWSGNNNRQSGVGLMIQEAMVENVIEIERTNDRIMKAKLVLGKEIVHIFSVYAPQSGRPHEEKIEFWEKLSYAVSQVPINEGLIVGGDLNGHVGMNRDGFEEVIGIYSLGERNQEGELVLEFCQNHNL